MKQKKMYLVSTEEYEDYRVLGVFSSWAKAEKYIDTVPDEQRGSVGRYNSIEEVPVNPRW